MQSWIQYNTDRDRGTRDTVTATRNRGTQHKGNVDRCIRTLDIQPEKNTSNSNTAKFPGRRRGCAQENFELSV